jgi:exonuclease III
MILLKHNNFEFKNILSGGYNILPNEPDVIVKKTMADGTEKRNYRKMKKTTIQVKFGRLNREMYNEYISHFLSPEDNYTYYDTSDGKYYTKKFFVEREKDSLNYIDDNEEEHEEFEITLTQCGED